MKRGDIYKCSVCGNVVELDFVGGGELVCCGKSMMAMPELNHDAGEEKHVPVITKTEDGYKVHIGSVDHPMEDTHYIEWIELIVDEKSYKEFLHPNQAPEAIFCVSGNNVKARAYCNLHGLWVSE